MFKKFEFLLVVIPFFYDKKKKIKNLAIISQDFTKFSKRTKVIVITNTKNKFVYKKIRDIFDNKINIEIINPNYLGHPYLLTWVHLDIFRREFFKNKKISHFLYIEDDIKISKENIMYWSKYKKTLNKFKLLPSFVRYEIQKKTKKKFSVDVREKSYFHLIPKIKIKKNYFFINLPYSYQAMYLMDRNLMKVHLNSISSNPDFSSNIWNIRERASQGVSFLNIPKKFKSRNVVGFNLDNNEIDQNALIHHIPNTYINKKDKFLSRILIKDLIYSKNDEKYSLNLKQLINSIIKKFNRTKLFTKKNK